MHAFTFSALVNVTNLASYLVTALVGAERSGRALLGDPLQNSQAVEDPLFSGWLLIIGKVPQRNDTAH